MHSAREPKMDETMARMVSSGSEAPTTRERGTRVQKGVPDRAPQADEEAAPVTANVDRLAKASSAGSAAQSMSPSCVASNRSKKLGS